MYVDLIHRQKALFDIQIFSRQESTIQNPIVFFSEVLTFQSSMVEKIAQNHL